MTTIILTIIGILLAAAAALMVIFYGGDAFNSGSTGAAANTVQNAGTNVISALQMYRAENGTQFNGTWADFSTGVTVGAGGAYMKEAPSLPTGLTAGLSTGTFQVTGVPVDVCTRINKNLKLGGATGLIASGTAATANKMHCVSNATAGQPGTFYANA